MFLRTTGPIITVNISLDLSTPKLCFRPLISYHLVILLLYGCADHIVVDIDFGFQMKDENKHWKKVIFTCPKFCQTACTPFCVAFAARPTLDGVLGFG